MIEQWCLRSMLLLTAYLCLSACAVGQLANVSLKPKGEPATPSVLGNFDGDDAVQTTQDWISRRAPLLRKAFASDFYGHVPDEFETIAGDVQRIDDNLYDGLGTLDVVPLTIRTRFEGGEWREQVIRLMIAKPKATTGPVPTILKMDFCPSTQVFQTDKLPDEGRYCGPRGFEPINGFVWWTLGRYHISPPIEEALSRGFAYASINVEDYVPDSRSRALARLAELSDGVPAGTAWGSLAAWAFQFSRAIDYLDKDDDLDAERTAIYGHSRYGKSALVAGALDERIDALIAHQSGRGGAALTRSSVGEPMSEMVTTYQSWLSQDYSKAASAGNGDNLPFDQHHLIALLAPRPVLLGHARRDMWSDPHSAFRAAQGASPAYELLGSDGFKANRLNEFHPNADIAFWIRGGTHGETKDDWPAFFAFLEAHFMNSQE